MKRSRPGNPRLAVAYIRVSTDEQHLGPEAQRAAIDAWAARENIELVAVHLDCGVSGKTELDDRVGLARALGELRAAGAGVLVVAKRDRLARDTTVAGLIERAVKKSGARVVTADGVANGDTPADAFMRAILDAAAEYERALIAARTKAALAVKRARGERVGAVPYGYRLGSDGSSLESHGDEQRIIADVRAMRTEGRKLLEIALVLTERGELPRSGGRWHATQIARMIVDYRA
jgi:site-specific DNA recombinase